MDQSAPQTRTPHTRTSASSILNLDSVFLSFDYICTKYMQYSSQIKEMETAQCYAHSQEILQLPGSRAGHRTDISLLFTAIRYLLTLLVNNDPCFGKYK
jgi:hypothetical protein